MEDEYDDYYDYHWTQDRACFHGEDADCNCRIRIKSLYPIQTCETCGKDYTCDICHDCSRHEVECTCPVPQWVNNTPEARKDNEGDLPF